jgi:hypothetical protein
METLAQTEAVQAWPTTIVEEEPVDLSLLALLANAETRVASEAEGYRTNPTDGNCRL